MVIFLGGQYYTGWKEYNDEREEKGFAPVSSISYFTTGHFVETTFENWESEFLQMSLYVVLTVFLRQKGSAESKKLDGKEEVDRKPVARRNSPWPVRKGGIWLKIYSHSLSIAFMLLFLFSFIMHFKGSLADQNEREIRDHKRITTQSEYFVSHRFWFESFQNWQSEFLAVASIALLSIWLRQKGSPESKPVDAPYYEMGE
jgi:hypothetical protein